jgi:hypothetical protein
MLLYLIHLVSSMGAALDLSGRVFYRLTVLKKKKHRDPTGLIYWLCRCACGQEVVVKGSILSRGRVRSCGCLQKEAAQRTAKHGIVHGMTGTTTYQTWRSMLKRCELPSVPSYGNYGARGITVCERWKTFVNFLADMGESPKGMTIDRKENNGNYEPHNCRWATDEQQANNRRTNIYVTHNGITKSVAQWAKLTGINRQTLYWRVRQKWSIDRVFS